MDYFYMDVFITQKGNIGANKDNFSIILFYISGNYLGPTHLGMFVLGL
jgi:hypothetical protein